MDPLESAIASLITIDGPAGSGKTTLAGLIEDALRGEGFSVATIHMDDLYDGWDLALSDSLTQTLASILDQFAHAPTITIPQYDWRLAKYGPSQVFETPSHLILEGVGSGQRITRARADIKLWVEAPSDVALKRVLDRDGNELFEEMRLWQGREASHFLAQATKSAADYRVKSAP